MESYYRSNTPGRYLASMKKSGKLAIAIGGILLGSLLLFFGNRAGGGGADSPADAPPTGGDMRTVEEYREALEARMEQICSEVAGVGEVSVVVTLAGGYEYVYAYDIKNTTGGESTSYITVGSGANESLVYITERAPAITGIGVVCSGGMDAGVRQELTGLLSAAFGVGSHKIYVTGRK